MKKKIIFFAGGGTGGHVYPALAMASSLKKFQPEWEIHFVGSPQGLENKIIPPMGFPLHLVPIGKLNRNVSFWERIKTVFRLPWSFGVSLVLLLRYRPALLVGVGGYASAPVVGVGALLGFRTVIWEPNAYPGLANRWLARWADLALVVFEEAKKFLEKKMKRIEVVGLPVRREVEEVGWKKNDLIENSQRPFRVLVFGGSQGARGLNETVSKSLIEAYQKNENKLSRFTFIHQTGSTDYLSIKEKYEQAQKGQNPNQEQLIPVEVHEYLPRIFEQYQWADLVVCRSGVSTLSELAVVGKPAVLVPFPFASDQHQQRNAEALVQKKGALMVLQKDFTPQKFWEILEELRINDKMRSELSQNIRHFYREQAADATAKILIHEVLGESL